MIQIYATFFREKIEILFLILTVLIFLFIFSLLFFDTSALFIHPEYYERFAPAALARNPELSINLDDLRAFFDYHSFDGDASRPRYFSWMFWVLDTKFRFFLFESIPFIFPSISLTWLFTFTLLPIFFFKFMKRLTLNSNISLVSTCLFLCSQGFLSTHAMLFHSAKPMTLVFLTINLYIASVMNDRILKGLEVRRGFYFKWFILLTLSLFWDELFYIFFLIAPVLFYKSIFSKKNFIRYALLNGALFLVFIFITLFIIPYYSELLFGNQDGFNFIGNLTNTTSLKTITLNNIWYNIQALVNSHINFSKHPLSYGWSEEQSFANAALCLFFLLVFVSFKYRKEAQSFFLMTLSIIIFFIFQQLLLTSDVANGSLDYGAFYMSCIFSLLFAAWIGLLLNTIQIKKKYLLYPLVLLLCFASYRHTHTALQGHILNTYKGMAAKVGIFKNRIKSFPYDLIFKVHKNRLKRCQVLKILKDQPLNSYWLFEEAKLYRYRQSLLKNINNQENLNIKTSCK
ncbi:MAG: hypothetical protein OXB88_03860 [Bacteriovoracales bacterium]|nr:hypothetical protein [Bacteriovoracales bacterium]